jgi:hypothetical protein
MKIGTPGRKLLSRVRNTYRPFEHLRPDSPVSICSEKEKLYELGIEFGGRRCLIELDFLSVAAADQPKES